MRICIYDNKNDLGNHAAAIGAEKVRQAIAAKGCAKIILATGASQFEMINALVKESGIDWSRV
ncbi:MAG: glucosamine-6-phosphate deaminase, partial [Treponema sp.]|nr:glucosamine-6-phosphate deaminase [Treponema sp.]